MAKAVLDNLDDVAEGLRNEYVEKDGKFVLKVEDVHLLPEVKTLKDENARRRIAEKTAKDENAKFKEALGDMKLEDVTASLARIPELELAASGKLDEKKIESIVEGRLASKTAPLERQIKTLTTQISERDTVISEFKTKDVRRTIDDSVRDAIGKQQGFVPSAVEDALLFAGLHLTLNEEGKVVTKEDVGVTPGVDATVWLTEMQQKKSHWWGNTSGGGANGNRGGGAGGGANPWTHDNWNMTEQSKIYQQNPQRAEQLAKSAGTKIGGLKPQPKK